MVLHNCPGPDRGSKTRPNMPEDIECPHCGAEVEMWTHDESTRCPSCSKEITRKQLQSA